jgi:hypothetical protein
MKFDIPKKLQLGGININIEHVDKCFESGKETDGQALYAQSKIELLKSKEFSDDYKEWVFWHELIHHIFNAMAEDELRKNEKIISQIATFLQQAIRTME